MGGAFQERHGRAGGEDEDDAEGGYVGIFDGIVCDVPSGDESGEGTDEGEGKGVRREWHFRKPQIL